MAKDYCRTGVANLLQYGKFGAQIRSVAPDQLEVRDSTNATLAKIAALDAVAATDLATLGQVQALVNGLSWKQFVDLCTTAALPANTITGGGNTMTGDVVGALPNIDGTVVTVGMDILVKDESAAPSDNGIWTVTVVGDGVTAYVMERRADALFGADATSAAVFCAGGVVGADVAFTQTIDGATFGVATSWVVFASVLAGVSSISSVGGGVSVVATGTGAATLNSIANGSVITAVLATNLITLGIAALAVQTGMLAANAVTNAKLAVGAACSYVWGNFTFLDAGSTVTFASGQGPVPASSRVMGARVNVTTAFGPNPVVVDLQVGGTSVMGTDKSDLALVDEFECSNSVAANGAFTGVVGVAAGLATGAATAYACYVREA